MALTKDFVEAHVLRWQEELSKPWYPYRSKWPSRLFHHAPIENAVKILTDGNLRSREDPENMKDKDVAAPGVIVARTHAHNSARLYFRPRTPTQYHIEGIRKSGECSYGNDAHAPVLVMMVFDSRSVLSIPTIKFCDRNSSWVLRRLMTLQSIFRIFRSTKFSTLAAPAATAALSIIVVQKCWLFRQCL